MLFNKASKLQIRINKHKEKTHLSAFLLFFPQTHSNYLKFLRNKCNMKRLSPLSISLLKHKYIS